MNQEIIFIRHAKPDIKTSDHKKGVKFLGKKENPQIIYPSKEKILRVKKDLRESDLFFSSPLRRCRNTISLITNKKIIADILLSEIDYGRIDGLFLSEAQKKYPRLFDSWKNGIDERFPNGENNLDVIKRAKIFLNKIKKFKKKKIVACTHNVVLRCLIGSSLRVPVKDWFKIEIPYFEPIKFILKKDKLEYSGNLSQKKRILKTEFVQIVM